MGLIKAVAGALGGSLADQWKEYFYCDAIPADVLVTKGQKVVGKRSANTKGSDNVISNGSGIVVAAGQFMIIVEDGRVIEFCGEPGRFTYDTSSEPSLFTGGFWKGIKETFKTAKRRVEYGGDVGRDQRVYYFNMKEIMNNKFGTASPILFRIVDRNINLDFDASIRCNGIYSYKITDPILFYTNVCGNVSSYFKRDEIDQTLKTEFVNALQPAFGHLSDLQLRPNQLPQHTVELCDAMNDELSNKWANLRGISVVSIAMNPVSLTDEDQKIIKDAQKAAMLKDPGMLNATLASAKAQSMVDAANNSAGAMTGFMGMGMASNMGGSDANFVNNAMQINAEKAAQEAKKTEPEVQYVERPLPKDSWTCSCGHVNTAGKFCTECGLPKPEDDTWTCECGSVNKGKFCPECGKPRPAKKVTYKCSNCGWEPADPENPPKFCPNCGDPFNQDDAQ